MIFNGREVPSPAIAKISFAKIFESFEVIAKESDPNISNYAKQILEIKRKYPFLYDGFDDSTLLEKHTSEIQQVIRVLFPDILSTNEIKAIMPPFNFAPIHLSKRFRNIMEQAGDGFKIEMKGYDDKSFYIYTCAAILKMYYNYPIDTSSRTLIEIPDKQSNIIRTYRLALNADMIEMVPTDKSIDITEEIYLELMDNFENIDLWKERFPPNSWIMRGVGVANLTDVTTDASLSDITSNLILKTEESIEKIEESIKRLFKINDLKIGFLNYENDSFLAVHKGNISGMMIHDNEVLKCCDTLCGNSYKSLIDFKKPLIVPDVDKFYIQTQSKLAHILKKSKLKSYIIAPLIHDDEVLGFLELGASQPYQLSNAVMTRLELMMPIISMAAARFKNEDKNNVEAIIQQECTTIHPSVKWRFEEEARKYLYHQKHKERMTFSDITFKEVIPLYGQLDIRESSTKRNEAVRHDLMKQMNEALKVVKKAHKKSNLPIFESLIFQIELHKRELDNGLFAGSEHKLIGFLKSEVYPVFEHLSKSDSELKKLIDQYKNKLDPEFDTIYNKRKDFDESVTRANFLLANFLDEKQVEAQQMFPHYFERYKTDGVEYNMYIGQSIAKRHKYDEMHLRNLQLWQLITMCEMEIRFNDLKSELPTHLEIASLILVYSTPLAVHFRMDEKKFDVEGAYNARYEIVKKRIDKAHIKGTNERITAPGKVTIIYSREHDAVDYRKYIQFLQFKGYVLDTPIEDYQIEDLQGITGLRALRFDINYDKKKPSGDFIDVEEIIQSIESQN